MLASTRSVKHPLLKRSAADIPMEPPLVCEAEELPAELAEAVVRCLAPEWRQVAKHVNRTFRAAVRRVERSEGQARLRPQDFCVRLELLKWATEDTGLDWSSCTCELRPSFVPGDSSRQASGASADVERQSLPPSSISPLCPGMSTPCTDRHCPVGSRLCALAAGAGNAPGLRWLVEAGCPWDAATATAAAGAGRLDIVQWVLRRGGALDVIAAYRAAARGGHVAVLAWLPMPAEDSMERGACLAAVQAGHLQVLRWMASRPGATLDSAYPYFCSAAARGGHLEVLQWLRERGCAWDQSTCSAAARAGHIELLRWAIRHSCPFEEHTCSRYVSPETWDAILSADAADISAIDN